jgi:hypothetical protein
MSILIGEIHTGLLQHSTALSRPEAVALLRLREGAPVSCSLRPLSDAVSPDIPVGVDCLLPSATRRRTRTVGAVLSRAALRGGRVIQAGATASVEPGGSGRRLPWPHYIARPGRLEVIGRWDPADAVEGLLRPQGTDTGVLDLGGIAARLVDTVQAAEALDRSPPLRAARTSLRWAVRVDRAHADDGRVVFTVGADGRRSLEMALGPDDAAGARELSEDLALHDWLLSTVTAAVEAALTGPLSAAQRATRLRPLAEHLLHLWAPGSRVAPSMLAVWDGIERRPGLTRQWTSSVAAVRDQIAAGTLELLERGPFSH